MRNKLPNALSLSRIVFALAVLILSAHLTAVTYIATVFLAVLAIITDVLDGRLARRWHVSSELGYLLDGLGDRAMHVAFLLIFLVRYGFHPVIAWLLIFREIAIYAVRVINNDWLAIGKQSRPIILIHATCLRLWIVLFLVRDAFRVITGIDRLNVLAFEVAQLALLWTTIILSYYLLFRNFSGLIDYDHNTTKS